MDRRKRSSSIDYSSLSVTLFSYFLPPPHWYQHILQSRIFECSSMSCFRIFMLTIRRRVQGSIEEKIYQRQITKQGISGSVVDMNDSSKAQFSLSDLKVWASHSLFRYVSTTGNTSSIFIYIYICFLVLLEQFCYVASIVSLFQSIYREVRSCELNLSSVHIGLLKAMCTQLLWISHRSC